MKLKRIAFVAACFALGGCQTVEPLRAQAPTSTSTKASRISATSGQGQVGIASWYGKNHQGRKTANGERFDRFADTAAHRSLPFNTVVKVTTLDTGRFKLVRINDRGPMVRGRIIDLSDSAAADLGIHDQGIARVRVEVVSAAP